MHSYLKECEICSFYEFMTYWKILTQKRFLLLTKFIFRNSSTNYAYYTNKVQKYRESSWLGYNSAQALEVLCFTHNNPKNPEYLIDISLLEVRHLIYIFLIILGPKTSSAYEYRYELTKDRIDQLKGASWLRSNWLRIELTINPTG